MKCSCGQTNCKSTIGFDSSNGFMIADGDRGTGQFNVIGLYLSVADAVTLAKQLRAFIISKMDEPESTAATEKRGHM